MILWFMSIGESAKLADFVGLVGKEAPTAIMVAGFLTMIAVSGSGLILMFAKVVNGWLALAFLGFAMFVACLVVLVFFASSSMYGGYGWYLLAGMVGGVVVFGLAASRADQLPSLGNIGDPFEK